MQNLLLKGVDANLNYLGIYPVHLAVEQADVNMVALLLTAGADPLLKANGKNVRNATQLAETMAADPKCKHREEARLIMELIMDPAALKLRFAEVQKVIERNHLRDMAIIRKSCIGFVVGLPLLILVYLLFFRSMKVEGEL